MSGTSSICLQQQFDQFGNLLIGGHVYTYQAGTLTPQNAFRDASLTNPWPNPLDLDASARMPQLWFADGVIRIRVTDAGGVVQFDGDALPVIGSSATTTPTAPTDPNGLYGFGDLKMRYGTGTLSGYVRCNGGGIGNVGAPGASERGNADTINLYTYLWGLNDPDLSVVGGRGGTANGDFTAPKAILLPDFRGVLIGGLDDMGASASGRLNAANWAALATATKNPTTLGAFAGAFVPLTVNEIPSHGHPAFIGDDGHFHNINEKASAGSDAGSSAPPRAAAGGSDTTWSGGVSSGASTHATGVRVRSDAAGAAATAQDATGNYGATAPRSVLPPTRLITVYIRL